MEPSLLVRNIFHFANDEGACRLDVTIIAGYCKLGAAHSSGHSAAINRKLGGGVLAMDCS